MASPTSFPMETITSEIVIRGDLVENVERRVTSRARLADVLPLLVTPPKIKTPILPDGTKLFHWDQETNNLAVVIELPPRIRSLKTRYMENAARIMMPWQYFVFWANTTSPNDANWVLQHYQMFWAQNRIRNIASPVIPALVPNVYRRDGAICFGSTSTDSAGPIGDRLNTIVNNFFASTFNRDLGWNLPSAYRSYARWAAESRKNPLGWMDWPEWQGARPLNAYIDLGTPTTEPRAEGAIPPLPQGMTFGRAAEWLQGLTSTERYRLRVGMNLLAPQHGWDPLPVPDFEDEDAKELAAIPEPEPPASPPEPLLTEAQILEQERAELLEHQPPRDDDHADLIWHCVCEYRFDDDTRCYCVRTVDEEDQQCAICEDGEHVHD